MPASRWHAHCKVDLAKVGSSYLPAAQKALRPRRLCREPPSLLWVLPGAVENSAHCMPATVRRKQIPRLLSGQKMTPWKCSAGSGAGFPTIPARLLPASSLLTPTHHIFSAPCSTAMCFLSEGGQVGEQSCYLQCGPGPAASTGEKHLKRSPRDSYPRGAAGAGD